MKNYEEMSDSQIAQKVFFFVSSNLCPKGGLAHISSDGFFFFDDKNIKRKFDPCNNPSDAWPIIVENDIALLPSCGFDWVAISPLTLNGFSSYIDQSLHGCLQHNDMNPLRAAMIVFLKMNEDNL